MYPLKLFALYLGPWIYIRKIILIKNLYTNSIKGKKIAQKKCQEGPIEIENKMVDLNPNKTVIG